MSVLMHLQYYLLLVILSDIKIQLPQSYSLLSVSDAEGSMKVTEIGTRPLVQDLLNHDVCRLKY